MKKAVVLGIMLSVNLTLAKGNKTDGQQQNLTLIEEEEEFEIRDTIAPEEEVRLEKFRQHLEAAWEISVPRNRR